MLFTNSVYHDPIAERAKIELVSYTLAENKLNRFWRWRHTNTIPNEHEIETRETLDSLLTTTTATSANPENASADV